MKKQKIFSVLLVCLLAFGLLLALLTCTVQMPDSSGGGGGGNNGGGGAITSLSGRYWYDDDSYSYWWIDFRPNGTFTTWDDDEFGSYTISGNTLRLNIDFWVGRTWTIVDSNTLRDGSGGYWYK